MTAPPAAARVDDRALDLVAARDELVLEVGDEDPEVRVVRARVHLRDEKDPHAGGNRDGASSRDYPRVTCRIPRHISSVVPSPQRT